MFNYYILIPFTFYIQILFIFRNLKQQQQQQKQQKQQKQNNSGNYNNHEVCSNRCSLCICRCNRCGWWCNEKRWKSLSRYRFDRPEVHVLKFSWQLQILLCQCVYSNIWRQTWMSEVHWLHQQYNLYLRQRKPLKKKKCFFNLFQKFNLNICRCTSF